MLDRPLSGVRGCHSSTQDIRDPASTPPPGTIASFGYWAVLEYRLLQKVMPPPLARILSEIDLHGEVRELRTLAGD
jgi:hypothetical protein